MALEKLIDTRMEKAGKSKLKEVKSKLKEIHCHKLSDLQAQQNVLNEWLLHEVVGGTVTRRGHGGQTREYIECS